MTGPMSTKTTQDKIPASSTRASNEYDQLPLASSAYGGITALQRAAGNRAVSYLAGPGTQSVPPIAANVLKNGSGLPLDPATREFSESPFGEDFGQVGMLTSAQVADEGASAVDVGIGSLKVAGASAPGQARQSRSLSTSLRPSALSDVELEREIDLIRDSLVYQREPIANQGQLIAALYVLQQEFHQRQMGTYSPSRLAHSAPAAVAELTGKIRIYGVLPYQLVPQSAQQLMQVSGLGAGFITGFLAGAQRNIPPDSWEVLGNDATAHAFLLNGGASVGVGIGIAAALKDNVEGLLELAWRASPSGMSLAISEEVRRILEDPQAFYEEKKIFISGFIEFSEHLKNDPAFLLEHGMDFGEALGARQGLWFSSEFTAMSPFKKGMAIGKLVGYAALEVALLLVGPAELAAIGKGALKFGELAKGTRLADAVLQMIERVPGLHRMLEARRLAEAAKATRLAETAKAARLTEETGQRGLAASKLASGMTTEAALPAGEKAATAGIGMVEKTTGTTVEPIKLAEQSGKETAIGKREVPEIRPPEVAAKEGKQSIQERVHPILEGEGSSTGKETSTAIWDDLMERAERPVLRQSTGGFRSSPPVRSGNREVRIIEGRIGQQIPQGESLAKYIEKLPGEHGAHGVGMQLGDNLPEGIVSAPAGLNLSQLKVYENTLREAADLAIEQGGKVETKSILMIEYVTKGGKEIPMLVGVKRETWFVPAGSDRIVPLIDLEAQIDPITRRVRVGKTSTKMP